MSRPTRLALAGAALLGACSLGSATLGVQASGGASAGTVWLCRPGTTPDPCEAPLNATAVAANGRQRVLRASDAKNPPVDCFYVYPTVSREPTANADLTVQPSETAVAELQASRFSQVCRVYAPMYRQVTLAGITGNVHISAANVQEAYASALSGFDDYLAHYNHGRGIVFIGHSQGSLVLTQLLRAEVDTNPSLRGRLVSAILLGGNVTVPVGASEGGDFKNIPACRARRETGCVVAYSSFLDPPPPDSIFGRTGQGVGAASGATGPRLEVLCVNPAALTGGPAVLRSFFASVLGGAVGVEGTPPPVSTPWVTYPGLYTGRCTSSGGATWLQITPRAGDPRPQVAQVLGPTWGLHLADVNLTLGDLVSLVGAQASAYAARHR